MTYVHVVSNIDPMHCRLLHACCYAVRFTTGCS